MKINEEIDNTIELLYRNVKNGGTGHIQINDVLNDDKATAVISVHVDERPDHKVLEDLYIWADRHGLVEVIEKIKELSKLGNDL